MRSSVSAPTTADESAITRARRQPALGTIRLHVKRGDVERHVELLAVLNLHLFLRDMLTHSQP